jgi:hypothetical protein
MNRLETPGGADAATLLARYVAEPSSASGLCCRRADPDTAFNTAGISDTPESSSCDSGDASRKDAAEGEISQEEEWREPLHWHADPNGLTATEVGAYFGAQIKSDAEEALRAAARLGPKRVLALLR